MTLIRAQFYESQISISPIQGVVKCFFLLIEWFTLELHLLLSVKNTQKVNKQYIFGFVKLGVWWAERDQKMD